MATPNLPIELPSVFLLLKRSPALWVLGAQRGAERGTGEPGHSASELPEGSFGSQR